MNGFRCMILGKLTIDYTIFQFSCSNRIDKTQSILHGKSTFLLTTKNYLERVSCIQAGYARCNEDI